MRLYPLYTLSGAGNLNRIFWSTQDGITLRTSFPNHPKIHEMYCRCAINLYDLLLVSISSSVNSFHVSRAASKTIKIKPKIVHHYIFAIFKSINILVIYKRKSLNPQKSKLHCFAVHSASKLSFLGNFLVM